MDLYFVQTIDTSPTEAGNWFEDSSGITPHGAAPTYGDNAWLQSGTCATTTGLTADAIYVVGGAVLSSHDTGTVTANDGTITACYADVTSNNYIVGTHYTGTVADNSGTGTISDNRATVTVNNGTISVNYGTVGTNNGTVSTDWTISTTRYFVDQGDHDGTSGANWSKDPSFILPGFLPSGVEDAIIASGVCDTTVGWSAATLTVATGAVLSTNTVTVASNSGTITTNSGGTVVDNSGTISTNSGTISTNSGTITTNNGTITTNSGTVTTNASGGVVSLHSGAMTTNSGTVTVNNNTITTNASGGVVTTNNSTITTNASGGIVTNNVYGSGVVTTNDGVIRLGTITGGAGQLAASAATNLENHTAGTNVTLPSGGGGSLVWW